MNVHTQPSSLSVENTRYVEVAERRNDPGAWTVEEIGAEGEIYQAIFYGPDAEARCREYARFKYGLQ